MADHPIISRRALNAQFEGDDELLAEVGELFLADYPRQLEAIRSAIARADAPGIEMAAHTLKGAVSNFAADAAGRAAAKLEALGREGIVENASAALAELEDEMRRLDSALRALIGHAA